METEPAYGAAFRISGIVHARLGRQAEPQQEGGAKEFPPSLARSDIEAMIDGAFWASLRHQEGYAPTISVVLLSPDRAHNPLRFQQPIPFTPDALARLAPAVERPGIHLGVWRGAEGMQVWGMANKVPKYCVVLEAASPGVLVIKESRGEGCGKFANIAVLEGDQVKILTDGVTNSPDCPPLGSSLIVPDAIAPRYDNFSLLVELAVSMRAHGRGGALLVVPAGSQTWRESIIPPLRYSVSPPFLGLSDLLNHRSATRNRGWEDAVRQSIDAIAGLTAVDGATVITDSYELLALGAKIGRRREARWVNQVVVTEPVQNVVAEIMAPTHLGGTRHLSAAQFAQDQRDSLAMVASQDGRFTIFAWSSREQMVHAHRVEALLL